MGGRQSSGQVGQIRSDIWKCEVVSLNTSGNLSSPYQYFEKQDNKEKILSNLFQRVVCWQEKLDQQGWKKFKWDMGTIDTKWKNRFSPSNIIDVGIKYDGTFMTDQQFNERWYQIYEITKKDVVTPYIKERYQKGFIENLQNVKEEQLNKMLQDPKFVQSTSKQPKDLTLQQKKVILKKLQQKQKYQIQRTRKFDLYCYKTLVLYYFLYGNQSNIQLNKTKQNQKQIENQVFSSLSDQQKKFIHIDFVNPLGDLKKNNNQKQNKQKVQKLANQYLTWKRNSFNKTYLREQKKLSQALQLIKKWDYDIIFFQQVSIHFITGLNTLNNFITISHPPSSSVIMINKNILNNKHNNFKSLNQTFLQQCITNKKKNLKNSIYEDLFKNLKQKINQNKERPGILQIFKNLLIKKNQIVNQQELVNQKEQCTKSLDENKNTLQANTQAKKQQLKPKHDKNDKEETKEIRERKKNLFKQILNLNKESIFQTFDNFILLNVHLNSNLDAHNAQLYIFINLFHLIRKAFSDKFLIFGGDLNFDLKPQQFKATMNDILQLNAQKQNESNSNHEQKNTGKLCQKFYVYPSNVENIRTVKKKRTHMQPQRHKALIDDEATKDFIFSNHPLSGKTTNMRGTQIIWSKESRSFLPSSDHPYDHYMIHVQINQR